MDNTNQLFNELEGECPEGIYPSLDDYSFVLDEIYRDEIKRKFVIPENAIYKWRDSRGNIRLTKNVID